MTDVKATGQEYLQAGVHDNAQAYMVHTIDIIWQTVGEIDPSEHILWLNV